MSSEPPAATTLLLVEDEPIVRMAMAWELESAGYRVMQASNAEEAIAILERDMSVRVVVTDVDMPGAMDGIRLARAVRDRWPPVHIVVVSGRPAPKAGDLPEGVAFFPKPCDVASLNRTLRRFAG